VTCGEPETTSEGYTIADPGMMRRVAIPTFISRIGNHGNPGFKQLRRPTSQPTAWENAAVLREDRIRRILVKARPNKNVNITC
jgi:hypothetical protein